MQRWRKRFLQNAQHVESGYLAWLVLHAAVFFLVLFILAAPLSRWRWAESAAFAFVMGMLLAATRVYVDHYQLCPARTTDEAYRVVQNSALIWLLFAVGAVFFVSHYHSLFFFFCMIWIAIYAAYLHIKCGRRALKPARDELLPTSSLYEEESIDYRASCIVDEIVAPHKKQFLEKALRQHWSEDEIRVYASREFL